MNKQTKAWTWTTVTDTHLEMTESDDIWWWILISVAHHSCSLSLSRSFSPLTSSAHTLFFARFSRTLFYLECLWVDAPIKHKTKCPFCLQWPSMVHSVVNFHLMVAQKLNDIHGLHVCVNIWVMCGEGLPRWIDSDTYSLSLYIKYAHTNTRLFVHLHKRVSNRPPDRQSFRL